MNLLDSTFTIDRAAASDGKNLPAQQADACQSRRPNTVPLDMHWIMWSNFCQGAIEKARVKAAPTRFCHVKSWNVAVVPFSMCVTALHGRRERHAALG